eukprot:672256-Amphidinium_carterae.1
MAVGLKSSTAHQRSEAKLSFNARRMSLAKAQCRLDFSHIRLAQGEAREQLLNSGSAWELLVLRLARIVSCDGKKSTRTKKQQTHIM